MSGGERGPGWGDGGSWWSRRCPHPPCPHREPGILREASLAAGVVPEGGGSLPAGQEGAGEGRLPPPQTAAQEAVAVLERLLLPFLLAFIVGSHSLLFFLLILLLGCGLRARPWLQHPWEETGRRRRRKGRMTCPSRGADATARSPGGHGGRRDLSPQRDASPEPCSPRPRCQDRQSPSSRRNSCLQEHEGCVVLSFSAFVWDISSMRKKKKPIPLPF